MTTQGAGRSGDEELQTQGARRGHSGTGDSVAETVHQFQTQEPLVGALASAQLHAMMAYTLPVPPVTAFSVIHAQRESFRPIYTVANMRKKDDFTQSTTAENDYLVFLYPQAAAVLQGDQPPDASSQPQPAHDWCEVYQQWALAGSPSPQPGQMLIHGAQFATAFTPTTFLHLGKGLRLSTNTQANAGPEQLGHGQFHSAQRANSLSYNNRTTTSQMTSTAGDTPEVTQTESNFSLDERLIAESQEIFRLFASDPKLHGILTPASKFIFSGWVPTDDAGMQTLDYSLKCLAYLFYLSIKEREECTSLHSTPSS